MRPVLAASAFLNQSFSLVRLMHSTANSTNRGVSLNRILPPSLVTDALESKRTGNLARATIEDSSSIAQIL